jgi:hypothetical protein
LNNSNNFTKNFAQIQGGAISYRSQGFIDDGSTIFQDNDAGIHSPDVAQYATNYSINIDSRIKVSYY